MRYVLHIGINKTGTSTLQHYLGTYRKELLEQGIWYPKIGKYDVAHHEFAQAIKEGDFQPHNIDPEAIRRPPPACETVLLSSENFHTVKNVPDVAKYFPPENTTVVVYLREHVGYYASWYQQTVQDRTITCSFPDFAALQARPFGPMVDAWCSLYGDRLKVRVYDRSQLLDGDIISDFFAVGLGVAPPRTRDFLDKNASISGNLLLLKLLLNHLLTDEENAKIVEELTTLARLEPRFEGRFFVSESEARKIAFRNREDRRHLKELYGIQFKVPKLGIEGHHVPELRTLKEDLVRILDLSKARNFALYEIARSKLRLLLPALS